MRSGRDSAAIDAAAAPLPPLRGAGAALPPAASSARLPRDLGHLLAQHLCFQGRLLRLLRILRILVFLRFLRTPDLVQDLLRVGRQRTLDGVLAERRERHVERVGLLRLLRPPQQVLGQHRALVIRNRDLVLVGLLRQISLRHEGHTLVRRLVRRPVPLHLVPVAPRGDVFLREPLGRFLGDLVLGARDLHGAQRRGVRSLDLPHRLLALHLLPDLERLQDLPDALPLILQPRRLDLPQIRLLLLLDRRREGRLVLAPPPVHLARDDLLLVHLHGLSFLLHFQLVQPFLLLLLQPEDSRLLDPPHILRRLVLLRVLLRKVGPPVTAQHHLRVFAILIKHLSALLVESLLLFANASVNLNDRLELCVLEL